MKLSLMYLFASFVMAHVALSASITLTTDPADPRPLKNVAEQLENQCGWRITYEEGPINNKEDLRNNVPAFLKGVDPVSLPIATRKYSPFKFTFNQPATPYDRATEIKIIDASFRTTRNRPISPISTFAIRGMITHISCKCLPKTRMVTLSLLSQFWTLRLRSRRKCDR